MLNKYKTPKYISYNKPLKFYFLIISFNYIKLVVIFKYLRDNLSISKVNN